MIHVDQREEPPEFDALVRRKGQTFLQRNPQPTSKQWRAHAYWSQIKAELHAAYEGICAYSCHWIPYDTGANTVEHFRPKHVHPTDAYEWSNYRLVCATLNGRKGVYEDVLDPFLIEDGWFVVDFPSMLVRPNPNLRRNVQQSVQITINRLGLNDEGTCLKSRAKWLEEYCSGNISLDYFRRNAPFIVAELERQGLMATIRDMFTT